MLTSLGLSRTDFGSTTIQSDLPSGRISPNASPHVRASEQLYSAEQRIGGTIDDATKSGGVLNLDFCALAVPVRQSRLADLVSRADSGWFDVDTRTVMTRCYKTLILKEDYVSEVLAGVPDLYGACRLSKPSQTL